MPERSASADVDRLKAELLRRRLAAAGLGAAPGVAAAPPNDTRLSFGQQRLWFLDRFAPGLALYNIPVAVRLHGPVDVDLLEQAVGEVMRRHEVLRTVFEEADGQPRARVLPHRRLRITLDDLQEVGAADRERDAFARAARFAALPFDLSGGPLLRVAVFRLSPVDHLVAIVVHHIVADGASMDILVREVTTICVDVAAGRAPSLPPLPGQYSAYVAWQHAQFESGALAQHAAFWRDALAGMPEALELSADGRRGATRRHHGAKLEQALDRSLTPAVASLAGRHRTTVFAVLLAAFQALVARYTGRSDIVVGTPVNNRPSIEFEPLIGFFVNTLVLRTALPPDLSFDDALSRTARTVVDALSHQDVPFEWLVQELNPRRVLSQTPLVQLMFSFQPETRARADRSALGFQSLPIQLPLAKFDLSLYVVERGRQLIATFEYDTDLFAADTIARLGRHYEAMLRSAVENATTRLCDVPLSDPEHAPVLRGRARPLPTLTDASIPALVARQAARTPSAIAVIDGAETLTYAELQQRVCAAAAGLSALGVTPGSVVGVRLPRSSRLVVSVLAALHGGAAYLPIDPQQPTPRCAAMLDAANARVCLVDDDADIAAAPQTRIVRFDALDLSSTTACARPANPTAYVIFTSGSTGQPKGVEVAHEALANVILAVAHEVAVGSGDRILSVTTPGFDIAALEWFLPLIAGATLVLATADEARDGDALARRLAADRITVLQATPATWRLLLNAGWSGAPALRALCGGEALPLNLARELSARTAALWNVYGPTETTIWSMMWRVPRDPVCVTLGAPIANTHVALIGAGGSLAPLGAEGEICVGGAGVAHGYVGAPALTAERFVPDPFALTPGARVYRTGDRGRRLADGSIAFWGRADRQLKLRGYRVEPAEVEAALVECRGVADCAVVPQTSSSGDIRLVAFVVAVGGEPAGDEWRAELHQRLPDYLIPAEFVVVRHLPLTRSGKVDRAALEEMRSAPTVGGVEAVGDAREERLLAIFAEVLQRSDVGPTDNFFDLGGHSLLAARVIARARSLFGVDVPLRAIFELPTARALAARIAALGRPAAAEPVPRRAPGAAPPTALSFAQERLYFLSRLTEERDVDNLVFAARVRASLAPAVLERCLEEIARRHEVFRTAFVDVGGQPQAVVRDHAKIPLAVSDAFALDGAALNRHLEAIARDFAASPFNLDAPPLARAALVRTQGDSVFVLSLHHLIADGPSIELVTRELVALYRAAAADQPFTLPAPTVQYSDYAAWQRAALSPPAVEEKLACWRDYVGGAATSVDFVTDRRRRRDARSEGAHRRVRLPDEIAGQVRDAARQQQATLFMTLLASWQAYVSRWAGINDFLVGTPVGNRPHPALESVVGMFANTIVVRADLRGDPSFSQLVDRIRRAHLDMLAHQDVPFEMVVDALTRTRDVDRTPLFQTMFTLQHVAPRREHEDERWEPLRLETGVSRYEVSLAITDFGDALIAEVEYRSDLFDAVAIDAVVEQWQRLLAEALRAPHQPLSRLRLPPARPPVAAAEPAWQSMAVARRFEAVAAATPDAPAVVTNDTVLTYRDLASLVRRHQASLRQGGVIAGGYMAIEVTRDPGTIALMLAALGIGAAYVPVAPDTPPDRRAGILDALGVRNTWSARLLPEAAGVDAESDPGPIHDQTPAYAIFTSGSTGSPNGVVVPQRALAHYVDAAIERFGISVDDRVLQFAALTFDTSVEEIFPTLASGATLVLMPDDLALSVERFVSFCGEHGVTVLDLPTAFWHELTVAIANGAPRLPPTVRLTIIGGEEARADIVAAWHATMPEVTLINSYGPTETTVVATACTLQPDPAPDAEARRIPLGSALPRVRVRLLDRHLDLVAVGVPGEICIGGSGVAHGYIGNPRLTAERFVPDPFEERPGARMFRSGDVARDTAAGTIEFLGRRDRQIKMRGYRIEPAEVERAFGSHSAVAQCVVVADHPSQDGACLVACVVAREPVTVDALRAHVRQRLPSYLVPSTIAIAPSIPRTTSGKIDGTAVVTLARATAAVDPVRAADPLVDVLISIWSDVLGTPIGAADDFFERGGHSLMLLRLVSALRGALGADVPVRAIFDAPSPSALATWLRRSSVPAVSASIAPVGRVAAPLTAAQTRVWETQTRLPGSAQFNVNIAVRIDVGLDPQTLANALHDVSTRHPVLGSRVLVEPDLPLALVPAGEPLDVDFFDLSHLPPDALEATARNVAGHLRGLPFELTEHGPVRVWLIRASAGSSILLASIHHIVADAVSVEIFLNELAGRYRALARGDEPESLPLRPTFMDYATWERDTLASGGFATDLAFWHDVLAPPLAPIRLPGAQPRHSDEGFEVAHERVELPPSIVDPLFAAAGRVRATPFMAAIAAITAVIGRLSATADVRLATMAANRGVAGVGHLIGLFANTIVLRTRLPEAFRFDELLARVRGTVLAAFEHQTVPFEVLLTSLEADVVSERSSVAPILVLWQYDRRAADDEWGARPLYDAGDIPRAGAVATGFDLVWDCHAGADGLAVTLMYRTARYDRRAIQSLLDAFERFIRDTVGGTQRA